MRGEPDPDAAVGRGPGDLAVPAVPITQYRQQPFADENGGGGARAALLHLCYDLGPDGRQIEVGRPVRFLIGGFGTGDPVHPEGAPVLAVAVVGHEVPAATQGDQAVRLHPAPARLDGFAASVRERAAKLIAALAPFGRGETIPAEASAAVWTAVRDLAVLGAQRRPVVWRISVKPSDGPKSVEELRRTLPCRVIYDWGGGLVWLAATDTGDAAGAMVVREATARFGGHATLVRAPEHVRLAVEPFEPQPAPVMDLQRRLKATFDPEGILNPGRMYAGV